MRILRDILSLLLLRCGYNPGQRTVVKVRRIDCARRVSIYQIVQQII